MANLDERTHFNSTHAKMTKNSAEKQDKQDKRLQYLRKKHDQLCQLLTRFIRL